VAALEQESDQAAADDPGRAGEEDARGHRCDSAGLAPARATTRIARHAPGLLFPAAADASLHDCDKAFRFEFAD
jgi:hypothetical protein